MLPQNILKLPGPWLDHTDREWASLVQQLLSVAIGCYNEAVTALTLYKPIAIEDIRRQAAKLGTHEQYEESNLRSISAKSFIYSLDATGQVLRVLMELPQIPKTALLAFEEFGDRFRKLHRIRNSLQHIEDRARGIGRGGKNLSVNVLVLGGFIDNKFGVTTEQGRHEKIEISSETIDQVRSVLEEVIWSFQWLGPGQQVITRKS